MIELKDLTYIVKEDNKTILNKLNVKFNDNETTVITGQNGSGKSTLIKLLMGVIKPTSGKILYNGKDITNLNLTQRAKLGFTIAFQQPVRFKGVTVKDMLCIAGGKDISVSQACEFLSKVGLCAKDYINRFLDDKLSGGELKRIELATSLCKNGEVFLFDEPEAGIDLWSFEGLSHIFQNLKNKTVIIVSHQKRIFEVADNILLLDSSSCKIGKKEDMLKIIDNKPVCLNLEKENG